MGGEPSRRSRRRAYWDRLCNQCGTCCHEKYVLHKEILYLTDSPCRFLDTDTNLCTIYQHRYTENRQCRPVSLFKAMFASYLPDHCGYVQWAKQWRIRFAGRRKFSYIPEPDSPIKLDDGKINK